MTLLQNYMTPANDKTIDLGKVLALKFKGKRIPRLAVRFLERFLRIEFINGLITSSEGEGIEFCRNVTRNLDLHITVEGLENVPADGTAYTFASNHPLGGADGVSLCGIIGEHFGSVQMTVNDFLMYVKPLAPICIPINKFGAQLRELPALLDKAFSSSDQVLIFPAGLCSRKIDGIVQDLPWTKTFVRKSIEHGRPIVPVHFIGENSRFFYRITNLSKRLGLKFNIGMACLPNEMYHSVHHSYRVIFGKPILPVELDRSRTDAQWADIIRKKVYNLE